MLPLKRFPGIIYNHKYVFIGLVLCVGVIFFLLTSWGFICTNREAWNHFDNLCSRYHTGETVGDLCKALCDDEKVESLSCHAFHSGKDAVFTVSIQDNEKIVIKSAKQVESQDVFDWIASSGSSYPSEEEFSRMVRHKVNSRLNFSLSHEEAQRLSAFASGRKAQPGSEERHKEMKQIWRLLHDNEYLLSMVYVEKEFFPRVVGSCGHYFGVEYLQPAVESRIFNLMTIEESKEGWSFRVSLGLLIMDLVEEIDAEDLLLCDIKPSHFGLSSTGKIRFLDSDVVFPRIVADSITGDGRFCSEDAECNIFDCRSKCNQFTHLCDSPILSNNLQVVCEKIFLGWAVRRQLVVPGLLMTSHTSTALAAILRQCADSGSSDFHNKERLSAILSELDRTLSNTYSDLN